MKTHKNHKQRQRGHTANSQHAVITLTGDLQMMTEEDNTPKLVHKEESNGRIKTDTQDRQSLCVTL